jgi:hypothetical protein
MEPEREVVLSARRPDVIDETVDGEAVVVDLGTGCYFALNPTGTVVWELARDGRTPAEVTELVGSAHGGEAAEAAEEFLAELVTEGLLIADGAVAAAPADWRPGAWADPPALQRFEDLQDLLLVDPIHDVTIGPDGWPATAGT